MTHLVSHDRHYRSRTNLPTRMCSALVFKALTALLVVSAVACSITFAAQGRQGVVHRADGATRGVSVLRAQANVYHRRLLKASDPHPPVPNTNAPGVALIQMQPQAPEAFAASLPRCFLERQATLVGQSVVTYDCRVRRIRRSNCGRAHVRACCA